MMLEIVDEAEAEQDQKKATAATQEPGEASAERSESPAQKEPSRNRAQVEPAPESTPAEVKNDIDADTARRPLYKRPAVLVIASGVLLVGASIGVHYWLYARSHESTDDAFIDGHIPPENATGNYLKVVQRLPVKIKFDEPPDSRHMLSPGMSVVPEVAIR